MERPPIGLQIELKASHGLPEDFGHLRGSGWKKAESIETQP
jgi:hypothetical protein